MKNLLENIKQEYNAKYKDITRRVLVCAGAGCIASGSQKIHDELVKKIKDKKLEVLVDLKVEKVPKDSTLITGSGCQGLCQMGPLVTIQPDNIFYVQVKLGDINEIIDTTLINNKVIERLLFKDHNGKKVCKSIETIEFYKRQYKIVLEACGHIDPNDIAEYIYKGGYSAAEKVYLSMNSEEICNKVTEAGLRGKGGKGFPTGKKWDLARIETSVKKYIICNGDEGDPGAFMDRSVFEGNPHSVIEGMMIAAKAVGSDEGIIYTRLEYSLTIKRIKQAIEEATKIGILGKNIFGTGYDFSIQIVEGAGAFVCGGETALISSIEGLRGMPRPKPPSPVQSGLWRKPTVINNVETLATIPFIINHETTEFRKIGTNNSTGTKTFSLCGHIAHTGLIEVPFGTTLREIIFNIGGGVLDDSGNIDPDGFKAVQLGGPSGNCLSKEHLDLPLDFDSLKNIGAMVGLGGLVVLNKSTCIVQIAQYFMKFSQNQSCGKCVLCREGTKQMLSLLNDIVEGNATTSTIDLVEQLAHAVQKGSLCALGKTASNPILSTLKYFREEYEAHVVHKKCPTKKCKSIAFPVIIKEKCNGCTVCITKCPTNAITGNKQEPHHIEEKLCNKCLACIDTCKLNAIEVGE